MRKGEEEDSAGHHDSKYMGTEKRGIKINPFSAMLYEESHILSKTMKHLRSIRYYILISMTKKETNDLRIFSHTGQQF